MGFNEIILLGCDLNYSKGISHFYGHQKGTEKSAKGMDRQEWVNVVDSSYGICSDFAKKHGAMIIDATKGGMISTVKKINYFEIFE